MSASASAAATDALNMPTNELAQTEAQTDNAASAEDLIERAKVHTAKEEFAQAAELLSQAAEIQSALSPLQLLA